MKLFVVPIHSRCRDGGYVVTEVGQVFRQIDDAFGLYRCKRGRFLVGFNHHDLQVHRGRLGYHTLIGGRGSHLKFVAGFSLRKKIEIQNTLTQNILGFIISRTRIKKKKFEIKCISNCLRNSI